MFLSITQPSHARIALWKEKSNQNLYKRKEKKCIQKQNWNLQGIMLNNVALEQDVGIQVIMLVLLSQY